MTQPRVAVVTGGNKGIGLEIVRSLCCQLGKQGVVYLTARDERRGRKAIDLLNGEGLFPRFHILDITDKASIERLRGHLIREHGGLDFLINNAGIGMSVAKSVYEKNVEVLKTNFFGVVEVSRSLIPIIHSGGRVVYVASTTAWMAFKELDDKIKMKFRDISSEDDVIDLMNEYLAITKTKTNAENGWPEWGYGISKLGLVVLAKAHAEDIDKDGSRNKLLINACCPGFVATDMTADLADDYFGGFKVSPAEGADTPVYLALLPLEATQPHGRFLLRRKVYDFVSHDVVIQI